MLALLPRAALAQGDAAQPEQKQPTDLLKATAGGLTADRVAERAITTSFTAKASEEALRAAAARVDASWALFLPRLSGLARYTRLSEFEVPDITFAPGVVISGKTLAPPIFNNWTFQGTIAVPISDYFLRISQQYSSAGLSRDAARYDLAAARAKAGADGRSAYYTLLRARGSQVVATQALEDQKTHATDAKNVFTVGRASKADVLRAETAVASAELVLERTKNLVELTEKQIRIAMHEDIDQPIVIGEGLEAPLPSFQGNLQQLAAEAVSARMELKSLDASVEAAKKTSSATFNAMFPQATAVANVLGANPNPRRFPARDEFFPTWDLSLQVTWSPNDILIYRSQAAAIDGQAAQLEAQRGAVRDGIQLEVTQAYQQMKEAEFAIETSKRELTSAQEAYRVAHELFINGSATSTTLTDAETELTRARLDLLNAQVDVRIARVRLDHAVGRDAKVVTP
jgi:outer membrane protein TolC